MWRILLAGLVFTYSLSALADEPQDLAKKPPYERLLKGEDAKRAEELKKRINGREAADDYAEAIKAAEELLALRVRIQGVDHHQSIIQTHDVAALRKVAALDVAKRAAWHSAMNAQSEARQLEAKAQYVQALVIKNRILELRRDVLGEEHPHTARSYNNVAFNQQAIGKVAVAEPLYQKALDIWRRVLGEDHPDTADGYHNVAASLKGQGKAAEAAPLYRKALDIRRRALGEEHPQTAAGYNGLAMNLNEQGKSAEAEPLLQKALDIRRRVLGEEHRDTATSYSSVAFNLDIQGKHAEAEPFYRKALDISRRMLGDEHRETAISYSNLARNLDALGKAAEAGPLHQRALDINRRVLGEEHPNTATSYNNMALNLKAQGNAAEAGRHFLKALDISRRVLGDEHPGTAINYNNVAFNLDSQGKAAEAGPLYRKALDISRRVLGEEHPQTAKTYINVAANLAEQGMVAEAAPLYQKALDISRRVLGEEHPDTATSYSNVAHILSAKGKAAESGLLYKMVLDIRRRVLGDEHPQTATSYNNVAHILHAMGKADEAEPLYRKALDIQRRVLGEAHPHTAVCYNNVAFNLHVQGKSTEAAEVQRRALFPYEASRLSGAVGLDRASLKLFNPRLHMAVIAHAREPSLAWYDVEQTLARGLFDEQAGVNSQLTSEESVVRERDQILVTSLQPRILVLVTKSQRTDEENGKLERILRERRAAEERLATTAAAASTRSVAAGDLIRTALPGDAALLMWVDLENRSGDVQEHFACVVRSTIDPQWERLPGTGQEGKWTKEDTALHDQFRVALTGSASTDEVLSLVKQLYAQRLAPVLKHLSGVKTLYVVPANAMAGVPVEALTREFTISYVPSGTFLARAKEKSPAAGTEMLAVGDPVFERKGANPTRNATEGVPYSALPPNGLLITQVGAGGAAAKASLQAGDVIVKYGETEITSMKALDEAMEKAASAKEVPVLVWRETEKEPFTRTIAPGKLGVALAKEPAREAIANRRKTDAMLLALRGGGWKELPGTRVELTQIGKLFGALASTLVDSAASEESLEALRKKGDLTKFRYLHFATHGEGNRTRAFESALILSQDNLPPDPLPKPGEPFINGQLSAREVLDYWKLDAELVTLSACETAVGKSGGGDGLLGFAQAFLSAGARSVCLSLWKVDDTATALLMQRFYQNLLGKRPGLDKPLGKAAALDEAKRWLRELSSEEALKLSADMTGGVTRGTRGKGEDLKLVVPAADPDSKDPKKKPFADPRYWAAFILIGDPN